MTSTPAHISAQQSALCFSRSTGARPHLALVLLLLLTVSIALSSRAGATVWTVDKNPANSSRQFATIQDALNGNNPIGGPHDIMPGDTIYVRWPVSVSTPYYRQFLVTPAQPHGGYITILGEDRGASFPNLDERYPNIVTQDGVSNNQWLAGGYGLPQFRMENFFLDVRASEVAASGLKGIIIDSNSRADFENIAVFDVLDKSDAEFSAYIIGETTSEMTNMKFILYQAEAGHTVSGLRVADGSDVTITESLFDPFGLSSMSPVSAWRRARILRAADIRSAPGTLLSNDMAQNGAIADIAVGNNSTVNATNNTYVNSDAVFAPAMSSIAFPSDHCFVDLTGATKDHFFDAAELLNHSSTAALYDDLAAIYASSDPDSIENTPIFEFRDRRTDGTISYVVDWWTVHFGDLPTAVGHTPSLGSLISAYPNPFNRSVTIEYRVTRRADISLSIHDVRGRLIDSWHRSDHSAGVFDYIWDSSGVRSRTVGSGVYFVTYRIDGRQETRKMVLVR